jgi:hypothetical protein
MFILKAKEGTKLGAVMSWCSKPDEDISGRYYRHTYSGEEGWWTNDLQKAKVYNTVAGAKRNWDASFCEVVPVKVELA